MAAAANRLASLLPLLLLLAACLRLPSAQAKRVQYCDRKRNYDVKVSGVDICPDPVVSGQAATFNISAVTGEAIDGGRVDIDVSFWGMHVHSEDHDLCEKTSCPIIPGEFVLSHSQTLPGYTPPGSYTLKMKLLSPSGHQLTCISFGFTIKFGSSVADS